MQVHDIMITIQKLSFKKKIKKGSEVHASVKK